MPTPWSTQQLAEFVAAVSGAESETAAALAAVERAVEALDADAAAIVAGGEILAQVGYPGGAATVADLEAVRPGIAGSSLKLPGVGKCTAAAASLEHPPGATLVVARPGPDGLTREETGLLQGMARVASLTMRMHRLLDEERSAREKLERVAREQAGLHRVAALVAEVAPPDTIFSAVAEEVGGVLHEADLALVSRYDGDVAGEVVGAWSRAADRPLVGLRFPLGGRNLHTLVFETGRAARIDRLDDDSAATSLARELGARCSAGAPIVVAGRLWGVIVAASSTEGGLPDGVAHRLADFTELVATAIAKVQAREELRALSEQQAALRRVATLVARGEPPSAVFTAVAEEVGRVVRAADVALVGRYESEAALEFVGGWSSGGDPSFVGSRADLGGRNVSTLVFERNEPVRVDYAADDPAPATTIAEEWSRSSAGAPINVEGRLWGVMIVGSLQPGGLPPGVEHGLADFTDLVAAAVANAQSRAELRASRARSRRAAEEQAALRRVATLVASATPPAELFAAVAEEVGRVLQTDRAFVSRYEIDDTVTIVASWTASGATLPVDVRFPIQEYSLSNFVRKTGQAVRIDAYPGGRASPVGNRAAVAAPITVEGRLWGLMSVGSTSGEPSPPGTEDHLTSFTELVATAIANAEARGELRTIADEQAALRRVATLVAEGAPPEAVFAAATEESGRLLDGDYTSIEHYEPGGTATIITGWAPKETALPIGHSAPLGGRNVATLVHETGRPARVEQFGEDAGPLAEPVVAGGVRCAVGAPISVEGRLWGVMVVGWADERPPPPGTEARLGRFTELLATAIANAEAQTKLAASRARIVASADETRRRFERDLHDGAQQRLVSLALRLRGAQAAVPPELDELAAELDDVVRGLNIALDELREFARGIHPAILAEGGLVPALKSLARRSALPVDLTIRVDERLSEPIEVAAYYVVSEALANAAKHAQASAVVVGVEVDDAVLRVSVRDDGVGGADFVPGSGLVGLRDRVEALGGRISLESPPGAGTSVEVELPPATDRGAASG